jgi:hypothetical protein
MAIYVAHDCKNTECNNRWLEVDLYNAQSIPPKWRYCPECQAKGMKSEKNPLRVSQGSKLQQGKNMKGVA